MQDSNSGRTALKAGVWYTISAIASKAVNLLTTPIFTRMIPAADYGLAQTFVSWGTLLMVFASLNLNYSIVRAKHDFQGQFDKYIGSLQLLQFFAASLMGVIMITFIKPVSIFMELTPALVIVLVLYLLLNPAVSLLISKNNYKFFYKGNVAISLYTAVATVAVTFAFIFLLKENKYYAKIFGFVLPTAVLSLGYWLYSIKKKYICINLSYWKYALAISLPLIIHSLSLSALAQSDRIMITKYVSTEATAIYSLAYNYAALVNIVLISTNDAWMPWFHDRLFEGNLKLIRTKVKPLIMFGCMLGIGFIALAPEAIYVLGPSEYQAGKWVVGPVVLGVTASFIYQQYVHIEFHEKKTMYTSIGTIIAAGANLILNMIFIPRFGFIAAAYTTMICYFLLMVFHMIIANYILKKRVYNDWYMFGALFITCGIGAVFMMLYETYLARFLVLFILCLLYLFINKDIILNYLKSRKTEEKV